MEKSPSIATLRIVGGHAALDLANTVDGRRDGRLNLDLLATYGDLLDWSRRAGLLDTEAAARLRRRADAAPLEAEAALARTKQLREAIYRVFSAVVAGADPPPPELDLVEREARRAPALQRLVRTATGYAWVWDTEDLNVIALRVAYETTELLTDLRLRRVKECFGRNCGWLFLDTSRSGLRRWCSDETCGTRARVARHRSKTRSELAEAGNAAPG